MKRAIILPLGSGTYNVGVRIGKSGSGYQPCTAFTTLVLPAAPSAHFTFSPACQGTAMSFTPDQSLGLQYEWNFANTALNLQQNPVRTFNGFGPFPVVLTVTNQYGCPATWGTTVNVFKVTMNGRIDKLPLTACEGNSITLNYNTLGTTMPSQFIWYHNEFTAIPYATTNNPSLLVNQSGQYFVYVQDSNGCYEYKNPPVSIGFIPLPAPPAIQGSAIACTGSPINLTIPKDPSLHYVWSVNNTVRSAWNDLTEISDTQTSVGSYTYSVVSQVANPAGGTCDSAPATFVVNVVAQPDVPQFNLSVDSCIPYQVSVSIANPQSGVNYYWSNGATGTGTTITHDGPLEVRAEIFNCSVTAQLDLPRDLTALAWEFPKGCYIVCKEQPAGYIVNPLGLFESWTWISDDQVVDSGSGDIPDFHQLDPGHSYQLQLNNGYCNTVLSSVSIAATDCHDCNISYEVTDIKCVKVNGVNLYQVSINVVNNYNTIVNAAFNVPGGEGYLDSSTLQLPGGLSTQTFFFYTLNGFQGGNVTIAVTAQYKRGSCYQNLTVGFPDTCEDAVECEFKYDVKDISCIKTPYGFIYQVGVAITNPFPISASTIISVPHHEGYFTPDRVQIAPGTNIYHFEFYALNGFAGGGLTMSFSSGFSGFNCISEIKYDFPKQCEEAVQCQFEYQIEKPECKFADQNTTSYQMTMSVANPYGTAATVTLSAPNGEGYFVPSILNLPAGSSGQTFIFYPLNGFHGGDVTVTFEGHWKEEICFSEDQIHFEDCCFFCRFTDLKSPETILSNLLIVAPNPAKANTTIYYNFADGKAVKKIVLVDMLGRTLQEWSPTDNKGTIGLDCSRYAQGQYLIVMKADDKVIENAKLITN